MPGTQSPVRPVELLVSCEHGGNEIPPRYRALFRASERLLASHRGYDPGALTLARDFATAFGAPLFYSTVSRLLVELNRSVGHPQLFSYQVPDSAREELLKRYYRPYRDKLEMRVAAAVKRRKRVLHLSCHSFTPTLAGVQRPADVGLLFDPARRPEAELCAAWRDELRASQPTLRVRRNYPYRGSADGLTTYLRARFDERSYAGIELEVNQKYPRGDAQRWRALRRTLIRSFASALKRADRSSVRDDYVGAALHRLGISALET